MEVGKRCYKCKRIKPISEFHKNRTQKDGLQSWCNSCKRKYRRTEKGKAARHKQSEVYRNSVKGKATKTRYIAYHPNQAKAQHAVNNAIAIGKMRRANTKLCHYCPKQAKHYHHHKGYEPEHWLDVVPACTRCHRKGHRKIA